MINPLTFFWLFFKASLLSTGGLGNLPFLHNDLIALGWASESDFITAIAVGQVSPGPTGLWTISLGYLIYGWIGAVIALVALSLPTFLIIFIAIFYYRLEKNRFIQYFTRGLSMGVIGLTLGIAFGLARSAVVDWGGLFIAFGAFAMALTRRIPVIIILFFAAIIGIIIYRI